MKFSLPLLAVCATIVTACVPPFNNFRYMGNETHDTATIIRAALEESDGNNGWAHVVGYNNPHTTWPVGSDKISRIHYCFKDSNTKTQLADAVNKAWSVWHGKIGDPGPDGHSLVFQEFTKNDKTMPSCYVKKQGHGGSVMEQWNTDVPGDTVVFEITTETSIRAAAITGYVPSSWDSANGRHRIWVRVNDNVPQNILAMYLSHELGHTFGLWHEHQRPDRDHYMHFECTNLANYAEVKTHVEQEGKYTMDHICKSPVLSKLYRFGSSDFSTEPYWDNNKPDRVWRVFAPGPYDVTSIMHYASFQGMNPSHDLRDVTQSVLAKWNDGGPNFSPPAQVTKENSKPFGFNGKVSDRDHQAIVAMYPWNG